MVGILGPDWYPVMALLFGTISVAFPRAMAGTVRRAELQIEAYLQCRSYAVDELELTPFRVELTRVGGGWVVLFGIAGLWQPPPFFWLVAAGYTAGSFVWLGQTVIRTERRADNVPAMR